MQQYLSLEGGLTSSVEEPSELFLGGHGVGPQTVEKMFMSPIGENFFFLSPVGGNVNFAARRFKNERLKERIKVTFSVSKCKAIF